MHLCPHHQSCFEESYYKVLGCFVAPWIFVYHERLDTMTPSFSGRLQSCIFPSVLLCLSESSSRRRGQQSCRRRCRQMSTTILKAHRLSTSRMLLSPTDKRDGTLSMKQTAMVISSTGPATQSTQAAIRACPCPNMDGEAAKTGADHPRADARARTKRGHARGAGA